MRSMSLTLAREIWSPKGSSPVQGWPIVGVEIMCVYTAILKILPGCAEDSLSFHYPLLWVEAMMFGALTLGATCDRRPGGVGFPSRFFLLPVTTQRLVSWHMLLTSLSVAAGHVAYVGIIRLWFGFHWPVWGPALFLATFVAWGQALMWSLAGSGLLQTVTYILAAFPFAIWLGARYGAEYLIISPTRMWELTSGEALFLGACLAAAYGIALRGVTRDRRGDTLAGIGFGRWTERMAAAFPGRRRPFSSPAAAQFWSEWRPKGIFLPVAVGCLLAILTVWGLIVHWDARVAFKSVCIFGSMGLPYVACLYGFALGRTGRNMANSEISVFLASRPLRDGELSGAILRAGAASILAVWVVDLCFMLFPAAWLVLGGQWRDVLPHPAGTPPLPTVVPLLALILGSPVAAWALMGLSASVCLTGRPRFQRSTAGVLFLAFLAVSWLNVLATRLGIRRGFVIEFNYGVALVLGLLFLIGTVWAYAVARRRGHIGRRTPWIAAGLWALLVAGGAVLWIRVGSLPAFWLALAAGAAALPFAPFATAPLALAWNRHR